MNKVSSPARPGAFATVVWADSGAVPADDRIRKMTVRRLDTIAANQRAELYYETHPGSPSAVRSPKLFMRSGVWIALLGRTLREGIAGVGWTVEAALRAFDAQYINILHWPAQTKTLDNAA